MKNLRKTIIKCVVIINSFFLFIISLTCVTYAFQGRYGDQIVSCTKIANSIDTINVAAQGGTNYGRYYVQTITGGENFYLYDLQTNQLIATIPFIGDSISQYKNNNANFSTEFYTVGDTLPLLYVSSAYDFAIHVFRIYNDDGIWKASVVQKISYPTINNGAGYYSCNMMLDTANGYLYLNPINKQYTELTGNGMHFFKFNMPSLIDGNIELTVNDAIDHYYVADYIHAPQGGLIIGNYLYQLHGVGNAFLRVFDLTQHCYVKTYKLSDFGYNDEPESLGYYNGDFYSMDNPLEVWRIHIEDVNPIVPTSGTYKTMSLTNWVSGSINPDNGNETTSTKIARTNGRYSTLGADKLTVIPSTHYSGSTTDGTYYKWRMIWYSGNTCLGLASEQCDFTTISEFTVPANADSFRIAIASVFGGKTQNTFNTSSFINCGGLTIKLFTADNGRINKRIQNWELGSFNADGTETTKTKIARTTGIIPTYGATTLTIDAPVHNSGSTTSTTYYKWCVNWYSGNTCLGLATEQTDFDTVTVYNIPANADHYRLKIASVVNGNTETYFPLSSLISNGGLLVKLGGISASKQTLTNWEIGSFNPDTGVENNLTRIARTTTKISTQSASILHVEPLVHYSGKTTAQTYYKWRIVWFNGSTCLGIAEEQTTFSTVDTFVIPAGADSFRMTIASVVNEVTEDPFPLSVFLENGGISIYLSSAGS